MRRAFPFLLLMMLLPVFPDPASAASVSDRAALVIGNGAYRLASPLKNPPHDAAALAGALERLGFTVTRGLDLSLAAMDARITEFARNLRGANVVFFYYAGHGIQLDGQNYLVPVDFNPVSKETLSSRLISMDRVLNDIAGGHRVGIVILDACRDNPLANRLSEEIKSGRYMTLEGDQSVRVIGKGLAEIKGSVGTLIAYATQPGNVAADGEGSHSPFAEGLLQFIESPGLEIRDILTQVRKHVIQETQNRQIPWDHSSLIERFYFRQKQTRSAPPP